MKLVEDHSLVQSLLLLFLFRNTWTVYAIAKKWQKKKVGKKYSIVCNCPLVCIGRLRSWMLSKLARSTSYKLLHMACHWQHKVSFSFIIVGGNVQVSILLPWHILTQILHTMTRDLRWLRDVMLSSDTTYCPPEMINQKPIEKKIKTTQARESSNNKAIGMVKNMHIMHWLMEIGCPKICLVLERLWQKEMEENSWLELLPLLQR